MQTVKTALKVGFFGFLLSGCTSIQPCLVKPNKNEPVLIRVTKGSDGVPVVTPELAVVLPDQEVIFMGKTDFKLHFVGLSPIDLKANGKKSFSSKNDDVIFKTIGKYVQSEFEEASASANRVALKESQTNESTALSKVNLEKKWPKRGKNYVDIYYMVEIDGVILDPRFRRADE